MKQIYDYSSMVSGYFRKHLAGTKNVSINTIHSYRDTFMLFNHYLETRRGFRLDKLRVGNLSRDIILEFLYYLEDEREYSTASRNQRLATLKSFARYVQVECPDEMALCQSILSIDGKRASKPVIQYLNNKQTDILMEQPDIASPRGRRDLAMLLLLYDSAARVQELCDLKVGDIRTDAPAVVRLFGKGRKNREVPITEPCAKVLRRYMQDNYLDMPECSDNPLFVNPQGKKLTRGGVSYVLSKYVCKANDETTANMPNITPHCLRHSKAMHLVEAGKNLI